LSARCLWHTFLYYAILALLPSILVVLSGITLYDAFKSQNDVAMVVASIIAVPLLAGFCIRITPVLHSLYCIKMSYNTIDNVVESKGIFINEGGVGCGKTRNAVLVAYLKALHEWDKIVRYVKIYRSIKQQRKLTQKEFLEYKEINETYNFYMRHPELIPLVVSNVKIVDYCGENGKRRESMQLLGGHLIQTYKLPFRAIVILDESGNAIEITAFHDREGCQPLDENMRLYRHYYGDESLFIGCEQNSERANKAIRDPKNFVKKLLGIKNILRPKKLIKKFDKLCEKYVDETDELPEFEIANKLLKLQSRISKIGFARFSYRLYGGDQENRVELTDGTQHDYMPCYTPFHYDTRAMRNLYVMREKPIYYSVSEGDLVGVNLADDYLRIERLDDERRGLAYKGQLVKSLVRDLRTQRREQKEKKK